MGEGTSLTADDAVQVHNGRNGHIDRYTYLLRAVPFCAGLGAGIGGTIAATFLGGGSPWLAVGFGVPAIVIAVVGLNVARRRQAPVVDPGENAADILVRDLSASVLSTESAARKLGAQVGETLSSTARIASQTAQAQGRVSSLSEQVTHGAAAMEEILAAVESLVERIGFQRRMVDQSAAAVEENVGVDRQRRYRLRGAQT